MDLSCCGEGVCARILGLDVAAGAFEEDVHPAILDAPADTGAPLAGPTGQ